jgi:hypothetical protein
VLRVTRVAQPNRRPVIPRVAVRARTQVCCLRDPQGSGRGVVPRHPDPSLAPVAAHAADATLLVQDDTEEREPAGEIHEEVLERVSADAALLVQDDSEEGSGG